MARRQPVSVAHSAVTQEETAASSWIQIAPSDSNVDTGANSFRVHLEPVDWGVPGQNTENAVLGTGTLQAFKAEL